MKIKNPGFKSGYTPITTMAEKPFDDPENAKMDFGVLSLDAKGKYAVPVGNEKSALLLTGKVEWTWGKGKETKKKVIAARKSNFDENPSAILLPQDYTLEIIAVDGPTELILIQTKNHKTYTPMLFKANDCRSEDRGAGTMRETSTRVVRTIYDKKNAPESNLVLGEVINYPGKWSSYPPHGHPQPEIYHYRFLPQNGFGFGMMGYDDIACVKNGDTTVILNNAVHSQTTAPGYAMYYVWAIRHLDGNPYSSPTFDPEHAWLQDPKNDSKIWPYPK